jgi:hypothetical protein
MISISYITFGTEHRFGLDSRTLSGTWWGRYCTTAACVSSIDFAILFAFVCLAVACDRQLYPVFFWLGSLSLRLRCEGPNAGGFGGDMRAGLLRSPHNMQARAISMLSCVGRMCRV